MQDPLQPEPAKKVVITPINEEGVRAELAAQPVQEQVVPQAPDPSALSFNPSDTVSSAEIYPSPPPSPLTPPVLVPDTEDPVEEEEKKPVRWLRVAVVGASIMLAWYLLQTFVVNSIMISLLQASTGPDSSLDSRAYLVVGTVIYYGVAIALAYIGATLLKNAHIGKRVLTLLVVISTLVFTISGLNLVSQLILNGQINETVAAIVGVGSWRVYIVYAIAGAFVMLLMALIARVCVKLKIKWWGVAIIFAIVAFLPLIASAALNRTSGIVANIERENYDIETYEKVDIPKMKEAHIGESALLLPTTYYPGYAKDEMDECLYSKKFRNNSMYTTCTSICANSTGKKQQHDCINVEFTSAVYVEAMDEYLMKDGYCNFQAIANQNLTGDNSKSFISPIACKETLTPEGRSVKVRTTDQNTFGNVRSYYYKDSKGIVVLSISSNVWSHKTSGLEMDAAEKDILNFVDTFELVQ